VFKMPIQHALWIYFVARRDACHGLRELSEA